MQMHIAVIPGDGIGPEITQAAKMVLDKQASMLALKNLESLIICMKFWMYKVYKEYK